MTTFAIFLCYSDTGDIMKSYLKIIIGAVLIGGLFAYLFYRDINDSVVALTNKEYEISLFQFGVFKDYDNAINYQNNFESTIIYEDNEGYFRVIGGIAYHEENVVKLEAYFTNKHYEYYIKKIKVTENFTDMLVNYETIMIKTDKEEVIDNINNSMLELFLTYLD